LKPLNPLRRIALSPTSLPASSGHPRVCCSTLHRTRQASIDVREYEPGEFEWRADVAQSACVLSGAAELSLADGRQVQLKPGASFFLPRGMNAHWSVQERMRTVILCNFD
jgi:uncharacterized cupin superfamily protein